MVMSTINKVLNKTLHQNKTDNYMHQKKTIPSGFEAIDDHLGGGYKSGTLFIARSREIEQDELQDFIIAQIKQLAVGNKTKLLVTSLGMNCKEFVKCIVWDSTPEQLRLLNSSPLFLTDMTPREKGDYLKLIGQLRDFIEERDVDLLIIDSAENLAPGNTEVVEGLLDIAQETGVPIIVSDYEDELEVGYPRDNRVTEMEIKTDINDTVQASILSNEKKTISEDLYGLWKVFEGILKTGPGKKRE